MNTFRKSLLIGLTVVGMGAASIGAQAQETPASQTTAPASQARQGHAANAEARSARLGERMEKYQAKLHDKLKLTAAQEPAWKTFIATATPKTPGMRPEHGAMAKMTAPERLEKWIAMSKERTAAQESRLASLKTFYAVLTPEQQKVFDDSVPGGKHGGKRGHRGMQHKPD